MLMGQSPAWVVLLDLVQGCKVAPILFNSNLHKKSLPLKVPLLYMNPVQTTIHPLPIPTLSLSALFCC